MIFAMLFLLLIMFLRACLFAYLISVFMERSKTEIFRDNMSEVIDYLKRNDYTRETIDQIEGELMKNERSYTDAALLQDIPIYLWDKIVQKICRPFIENDSLFEGCSTALINQIVIKLHEEILLPGEYFIESGSVADRLYFKCHGVLDYVEQRENGTEERWLCDDISFGHIFSLCSIPQLYTIQARDECRLLWIEKSTFTKILKMYPQYEKKILKNLQKAYDTFRVNPPMRTSGSSPLDAFTSFPGILDSLPTKGQISLVNTKDVILPNLPKWSYMKQGKEMSITRPCELIKENSRGYNYVPPCDYEEVVQMVAKLKSIISEGDASASSLPDVSPPTTAVASATGEPVFQGTNAPTPSEIEEETFRGSTSQQNYYLC